MTDVDAHAFDGKVAVVTGSSSGIGLEIARQFARAGASVVTNGRSAERASAAANEIKSDGGKAAAVDADVRTFTGARRLAEGAVSAFGGIDILVNNAGISMIVHSSELEPEDWTRTIETNLSGPFFCSRAAYPSMKSRGGGVIVNIGSAAGHMGLPDRAAYCAAKHGIVGLTKTLSIDWAKDNIRVLSVDPAYIRTPLDSKDRETGSYDDAAVERRTPMGRFGGVDEVAAVVIAACGPAGSYMTGSSLLVDGGWVAYGFI